MTKGSVRILDGVDLVVEPGTFVALIGPSGAGKSTLLGLLAGLETPDEGSVEKDGAILARPGLVAYLPQSDLLLPWRSVVANVSLGLEATGAPPEERRAKRRWRRSYVSGSESSRAFPRRRSRVVCARVSRS